MSDFLPFVIVGLTSGSVYGLAGTGLVLTYKTSGIFNFAHGTIAALMAYAFYDLREQVGIPWPLAAALCMFVLAPLIALVFERMGRRLADAPVAMKVVASIGLVVGIQQLIIIRYGAGTLRNKPFLPTRTFRFLDVNIGADQIIVMVIALVGMIALTMLFSFTRLGRNMRAVVDNPGGPGTSAPPSPASQGSCWHRRSDSTARCSRCSSSKPSARRPSGCSPASR
jgi:branched-subunit amino acid ABC-type transport system permease component